MSLSAILYRGAGDHPLLIMEVLDNGPGLPGDALKAETDNDSVDGYGLRIISRFSDSLFIGGPNGCLIILKTLEGGKTNAN
jgi:anti-sigma regulatory factor (Ser/Thr protein kinase)